jgi:hypothetical protein
VKSFGGMSTGCTKCGKDMGKCTECEDNYYVPQYSLSEYDCQKCPDKTPYSKAGADSASKCFQKPILPITACADGLCCCSCDRSDVFVAFKNAFKTDTCTIKACQDKFGTDKCPESNSVNSATMQKSTSTTTTTKTNNGKCIPSDQKKTTFACR